MQKRGADKHNIQEIETHRLLVEECLTTLLQGAESVMTIEKVRGLIFEAEPAEFHAYVATMIAELDCYDMDDTDNTLLEIIQDAWNYFPHRFLRGRCPAEIMM